MRRMSFFVVEEAVKNFTEKPEDDIMASQQDKG